MGPSRFHCAILRNPNQLVQALVPLQPPILVQNKMQKIHLKLLTLQPCSYKFCHSLKTLLIQCLFVVHCVEHQSVGWIWRLKKDEAGSPAVRVMCMIVHFLCFELQCNRNELNMFRRKLQGSQPFVSWVDLLITRNEALGAHTCPIRPSLRERVVVCASVGSKF
jgi:hypothetical protein